MLQCCAPGRHFIRQLAFLVLVGGAIVAAVVIVAMDDKVEKAGKADTADEADGLPHERVSEAGGIIMAVAGAVAWATNYLLPMPRRIAPQNAAGQ